ncbi:MAG: AmmeMemoRadiSam system protein B [Planctomycetota bacterium]|nr:AmmeMemoRadiSam system protein B [Planctomycetota bacterium]
MAGQFYPGDANGLKAAVTGYLKEAADDTETNGRAPKALIVPHAGYAYSGSVAASGYARIAGAAETITRVVLLGPAHRLPFEGLALPRADGFETPLGIVPVDADAVARIEHLAQVRSLPSAYEDEHSLEVHLPFLQTLLGKFSLVPLVVKGDWRQSWRPTRSATHHPAPVLRNFRRIGFNRGKYALQ